MRRDGLEAQEPQLPCRKELVDEQVRKSQLSVATDIVMPTISPMSRTRPELSRDAYLAIKDQAPFQNCIVTGMVLAEDGRKMSKSLKNYPDPTHVIDEFGADALRAYLINSPIVRGEPLRFVEVEPRFRVAVIVDLVGPALNPERRRGRDRLAPFQRQ